jgi:hypothetical protein
MGVREEKGGEPPGAEAVVRAESQPMHSRKPYHKPAFRYESVFETTALSCGKVNSTQFSCRFNRHSS